MSIDPLIVDVYQNDGPKDWQALAAVGPPWHGAILKATQGTYYDGAAWFDSNWRAVSAAGGARYGVDWFRGAYHYLDIRIDGAAQADFFLKAVARAGGWDAGDLWPMVDVERAGQRGEINAARIIDCVTAFVERVRDSTGRDTMLYGGSFLAEQGITERMGAKWLAIARYTPTLPSMVITRIGWDLASLALWQYCGDGVAELSGYPREAPGCGKVDISALVLPGGIATLREQMAGH
jgi:GH25 family lysozyme M1 (1,4-beta-N-acetylmuramidase)